MRLASGAAGPVDFVIKEANEADLAEFGELLVRAYSALEGFPDPVEQPQYYEMLRNVREFALRPGVTVFVATAAEDEPIAGGVVYFSEMSEYRSGGSATSLESVSGMRLLAVDATYARRGIGSELTRRCIAQARADGNERLVLHTTRAMPGAWRMYESMGFERLESIDFQQSVLPVFGFQFRL